MRLCREAHWRYPSGPHARFRCGTKFENGDAPFCNSDSTAAAYATARQCSESTARLQRSDASGSAYGPGVLRRCSLPENDLGYVPIANRLAESFDIYSRSTPSSNFEIGSRHCRGSIGGDARVTSPQNKRERAMPHRFLSIAAIAAAALFVS